MELSREVVPQGDSPHRPLGHSPTQRNCSISPSSLTMTIVVDDMVEVGLVLPADNSILTENLPTLSNDQAERQLEGIPAIRSSAEMVR